MDGLFYEGMHYEGDCIRPPSEANSILLQVTLGCSHNKCTFCDSYKKKRFQIKDDKVILNDILFASKAMKFQDRVFLMDGDALIIPQKKLRWILTEISTHLPWVKRVGAYANAKSIEKKSISELNELYGLGLRILYLGVESGDDQILSQICKGTDSEHLIAMGKKVRQADITLSVTVLLGIAGSENSLVHARATGELLSAMDPDYVGALTVLLRPGTPLYRQYQNKEFELPDQIGLLKELREMLSSTNLSQGLFISNHASNYLTVKAQFPDGKDQELAKIDQALQGNVDLKPEWLRAL